jgi:hypothetical protein
VDGSAKQEWHCIDGFEALQWQKAKAVPAVNKKAITAVNKTVVKNNCNKKSTRGGSSWKSLKI